MDNKIKIVLICVLLFIAYCLYRRSYKENMENVSDNILSLDDAVGENVYIKYTDKNGKKYVVGCFMDCKVENNTDCAVKVSDTDGDFVDFSGNNVLGLISEESLAGKDTDSENRAVFRIEKLDKDKYVIYSKYRKMPLHFISKHKVYDINTVAPVCVSSMVFNDSYIDRNKTCSIVQNADKSVDISFPVKIPKTTTSSSYTTNRYLGQCCDDCEYKDCIIDDVSYRRLCLYSEGHEKYEKMMFTLELAPVDKKHVLGSEKEESTSVIDSIADIFG